MWRPQLSILRSGNLLATSGVTTLPVSVAAWGTSWSLWWLRGARIGVLVLTDIAALCLAAGVGYLLWARLVLHQPLAVYANLAPLFVLFPLGYLGAGLYPGFGVGAVETLRRLSYCTSFAFLGVATASFAMRLPPHYSRVTFCLAWGLSLLAVPLLRFCVLSVANQWSWWQEPAVLVGSEKWVRWITHALRSAVSFGYQPVGILSADLQRENLTIEDVPVLGGLEWAPRLAERGVCVALTEGSDTGSFRPGWLQQYFRQVMVVREYGDLPSERARVCNLGGVLGVEFTNNLLRWRNRFAKRTLDVVLGGVLLTIALPLIGLGSFLVKLFSEGPAFFCQEREGFRGHAIKVWKLRTMYRDAEPRLKNFLATNPELRREWETHFKLAQDPRIIPRVGAFLRRFSVDELPQLWSVVKGEMSLVGPRPFPEYHLKQFPPEFRELRRRVRPGLTGMWQVTVRSSGGVEEQQRYDTHYIRNWSIWLDLHVLARTLFAVITGRGAY